MVFSQRIVFSWVSFTISSQLCIIICVSLFCFSVCLSNVSVYLLIYLHLSVWIPSLVKATVIPADAEVAYAWTEDEVADLHNETSLIMAADGMCIKKHAPF